MSLNCSIYARYSSDQQSPASIDDQIRKCREYADQRGWVVLEDHIYFDAAQSGVGSDRPGLIRLMEVAKGARRPFQVLLVDDISRLSRSSSETHRIFEDMEYVHCRVIAVSQGIDSAETQAGTLVSVHSLVGHLYVKELAAKTRRGLEGKVLRGLHAGGRCYGYSNVAVGGEHDGVRLAIDEAEASVVRRIFEMYADGLSLKGIAKRLNAEGVPPPRPRRGRVNASWCFTGVRAMLRNERYCGRVYWDRRRYVKRPGTNKRTARERPRAEWLLREIPETRIVDENLWARVQTRLTEVKQQFGFEGAGNRGLFNRAASSPYLLTGFLKCGACGANLTVVRGRGGRRPPVYGCPRHHDRGACSNSLVERLDHIEQILFAGLQREVFKPRVIEEVFAEFRRQLREYVGRGHDSIIRTAARRQELEAEIQRLADAVASEGKSRFLLEAITSREKELEKLTYQPGPTVISEGAMLQDLKQFVMDQIGSLRTLLSVDVVRARAELSKHLTEIRLVPTQTAEGGHYIAEGQWNLLGSGDQHAWLVAGVGFGLDSVS